MVYNRCLEFRRSYSHQRNRTIAEKVVVPPSHFYLWPSKLALCILAMCFYLGAPDTLLNRDMSTASTQISNKRCKDWKNKDLRQSESFESLRVRKMQNGYLKAWIEKKILLVLNIYLSSEEVRQKVFSNSKGGSIYDSAILNIWDSVSVD